jgi:hypothetical protein
VKSAIDFLIAAFTVGNGRLLLFATGHYQGKADISLIAIHISALSERLLSFMSPKSD